MKKIFLFAAAVTLAACSSDDLKLNENQSQAQLEPGAIGFDVYAQKTTTRGGVAGSLTTEKMKKDSPADPFYEAGFGVFGYYTDNNEYEQRSVPNFMYNQQVNWDGTKWDYSPVMYWPNEYGSNATSDDQDKLTFFAYAPWIQVIPTSGKLATITDEKEEQWGITGMTRNSAQGDPILKYIASFNANRSVDLCWGVADNNDGKAWGLTQTGTAQTPAIENGTPWLNLERPATIDQKVKFTFKHATAQMQVNIDADVDVDGRGEPNPVAAKTRVWVRSITFKGFALKGSLNLNNETENKPKWLDYGGQNELVAEDVIVYDGRKDGKEGVAGAVATNEKSLGLNPTIIQDGVYALTDGDDVYKSSGLKVVGVDKNGTTVASTDPNIAKYTRTGVTKTPVPLFCQNTENQNDATGGVFHVIPTDDNFDIEIVYDIETVDANLAQNLSDGATKGSSIENRISKEISFGSIRKLEAGHSYKLNLHLGMNSVKFDAAVVDWIVEPTQDVDLPLNIPAFAAATNHKVALPYQGNYAFAITGLAGGESMTNDAVSNIIMGNGSAAATSTPSDTYIKGYNGTDAMVNWTATKNNANTSGVAIQEMTIYPNDNTIDRTQVAKWTGSQSGKVTTMTFVQAAHPLFMQITKFANSTTGGIITLTRYDDATHTTSDHWGSEYGWICDVEGKGITEPSGDNKIEVYRNGTLLNWATTISNKNDFTFKNNGIDNANAEINIGDKLHAGDIIEVVLTTGDAPTETVTARYDGFYFVESTKSETYRAGATDIALPELKNAYGSVSYTISPAGVATINSSTGKITGMTTSGTATITATDEGGNTTTLELTVTKQTVEIVNISDETLPNKTLTEVASGETIHTFNANGKGEYDDPVGNVTYNLYTAKKGDVNVKNKFTFDAGTQKLKTAANLESGTYVIRFLVNLSLDEDKYVKPAQKSIYITFTVD